MPSEPEQPLEAPPPPFSDPITLKEVLFQVNSMVHRPLHPDDSPKIEGSTLSVSYVADKDTQFVDREAFITGVARYQEEINNKAELEKILEEGLNFAGMLYTWRGCSKAASVISSSDQPNRMEAYETISDVLEPEIEKLRELYEFQKRAVSVFTTHVKRLCKDSNKTGTSQAYLYSLGRVIGMFATLDEIKNTKASLKNDYAAYKRAAEISRRMQEPALVEQSQHISMFLGTHNIILSSVKSTIQSISGFDDLFCSIISTCMQLYENHMYLLPSEKHGIVKVIGFSLYVLDGETVNINKLDGKHKISLNKIDKMFKQVEVVPLYGDIMKKPFDYIKNLTPNYDPGHWPHCNSEAVCPQSQLLKPLPAFREEHLQLTCRLALHGGSRELLDQVDSKIAKTKRDVPRHSRIAYQHKTMYDLALRSLKRLSEWTSHLTEVFAWKLLHPACNSRNKQCPEEAEDYERAIRYNYTSEEKYAFVEVLSMIKSVQDLVYKMGAPMSKAVSQHIYDELQEFVQSQLRDPMRKAVKHKKDVLARSLSAVHNICADIAASYSPSQDPAFKGKKDLEFKVELPQTKVVGPSSTQLYMLRSILESIVDKSGKKSMRKDLDPQHITAIENFLKISHFWAPLINLQKSLEECCDLSQLWYREFYLEMTKGHKIQFPITMSMPWILAEHILDHPESNMIQYILYPMDLYNDSAQYALRNFKKQYLYEEIEAELNLVFDQLTYKLSEEIFTYYKQMAATIYLSQKFLSVCKKNGYAISFPHRRNYGILLRQQHVQLLGRSVDLKELLRQRLNDFVHKSVQAAITRFETGSLTDVMELEGLLAVNQLTHQLLSRYLELDPFPTIVQEANHNVTFPSGLIALCICMNTIDEFLSSYCYNAAHNRFVKNVFSFAEEAAKSEKPPSVAQHLLWGSKKLQTIFSTIYGKYSNFVGPPHFQSICRLMGYGDIILIVNEILKNLQYLLEIRIMPYLKMLKTVMPKRCLLPKYEYTSPGVLQYYLEQLKDIASYPELQPGVYHNLRQFGNGLLFCLMLEQALAMQEVRSYPLSSLFQQIIPKPFVPKKKKVPTATLR